MKEKRRKIIRVLLIIISTFLFIKLIMSFKKDTSINQLTDSKRLVSTEIVKLESNILSVPVYGKLSSLKQIDIVTEANGIFYGKKFKTGKRFSKGDTLGFIKYDEIESNLNSRKSELLNQTSKIVSEIKFDYPESFDVWYSFMDKINFSKPIPELPKVNDKKLRNYLSGKSFFTTYFNVKSTEDRLNKHIIISEFSGILSEVNIKSGTAVIFGQKIGRYHNTNILEFESNTSIKNTLIVKRNMNVIINSDEFLGTRTGYVSRTNKTLNSSSQNMSVFIETKDKDLYNGMYVHGDIIVGEVDSTYKIKRNLIENNHIFTIVNNKIVPKKIEVVQTIEENAIIKGLNNNDRILSEPIKGLYSGMEVRFKE